MKEGNSGSKPLFCPYVKLYIQTHTSGEIQNKTEMKMNILIEG